MAAGEEAGTCAEALFCGEADTIASISTFEYPKASRTFVTCNIPYWATSFCKTWLRAARYSAADGLLS